VYLYAMMPLMGGMMLIRTIQVMYQDFTASETQKQETGK